MSKTHARFPAKGGFITARLRDVRAVEFVRKMRGGSQAAMLLCSDGRYYIVKMMGNPQGTNVLGNEFLATSLASVVDLPTTPFASVLIPEDFIESRPAMWFDNEVFSGRPIAGLHFGSLLVGESFGQNWPTERLSTSHLPLIANRQRFVEALVFDIWVNNQDNRQAIFTEGIPTSKHRTALAYFIDHGFAFGGPEGNFDDSLMRYFYMDFGVYKSLDLPKIMESAIDRFRTRIPRVLTSALSDVPREWYSFDQKVLQDTLLDRLDRLDELVRAPYELVRT